MYDMTEITFEYVSKNRVMQTLFLDNMVEIYHVIKSHWNQPHRYYHSEKNHLIPLLNLINEQYGLLSDFTSETLEVIAYFHDIIYNPKSQTNEEDSSKVFKALVSNKKTEELVKLISEAILDTKHYNVRNFKPSSETSGKFMELDVWNLLYGSLTEIRKNDYLIFKEFQFVDYYKYRINRNSFLTDFILFHDFKNPEQENLLKEHKYAVQSWRPKIGMYAGSFNPWHAGHSNILKKAEEIFDKVIIAIGKNPEKSYNQETVFNGLSAKFPYHEILKVPNLLTYELKVLNTYADVTLVRGLRNGNDFAYELNQHRFMQDMYPELKTVWIPCDREVEYISSSALRNLEGFDVDWDTKKKYFDM